MTAASNSVPLNSAMPLTGLIDKQMKPVPPPSGDRGSWMKPPAPLSVKNAPKTAVYDQQRCQRFQSEARKHRQRCQRFQSEVRQHHQRCHQFHHSMGKCQQWHSNLQMASPIQQRWCQRLHPGVRQHHQRCQRLHPRARKPNKVSEDSTHRNESTRSEGAECSRSGAHLTPTSIVVNSEAKSHSLRPGQYRDPTAIPIGGGLNT